MFEVPIEVLHKFGLRSAPDVWVEYLTRFKTLLRNSKCITASPQSAELLSDPNSKAANALAVFTRSLEQTVEDS